ncbi:MAG: cytochrome-c peroxidase [Phycisphaerae bacterium]|jgi:cytochrome c peroxidase|nr:cytochrome-c peroxidase [Phycisphaerae bacterium]
MTSTRTRFILSGLAVALTGSGLAFTTQPAPENTDGGSSSEFQFTIEMLDQLPSLPGELGALPASVDNPNNPTTPEKVELGNMLFFDTRLSRDHSMSCATCHDPNKGWADGRPLAQGFGGKVLGRHSPTVLNAAFNSAQFWDGRAPDLEAQAIGPIMATGEMNSASEAEVIERLSASKDYRDRFQKVFGSAPTLADVGKAIAAFERTVISTDSRFDAYCKGDKKALTDSEKRGLILFFGKASCTQCHSGPNFSDNKYHNLGGHGSTPTEDLGRYGISKDEKDRGAFKTATCRSVDLTGPYMHDGRLATLEEVVDYYNAGGGSDPKKSELMQPLNLTASEKTDLVAFLKSLTGSVPGIQVLTAVDDAPANEPE